MRFLSLAVAVAAASSHFAEAHDVRVNDEDRGNVRSGSNGVAGERMDGLYPQKREKGAGRKHHERTEDEFSMGKKGSWKKASKKCKGSPVTIANQAMTTFGLEMSEDCSVRSIEKAVRNLYSEDFYIIPESYGINSIDDVIKKQIGTDENPEVLTKNCLNENAKLSWISISADIDEDDILTWKTNFVEIGEGTRYSYVGIDYRFDVTDCDWPMLISYEPKWPAYELPFEYVPLKPPAP